MKILLTGRSGQVGYELERSLQGLGEIVALNTVEMDLADPNRVREVIRSIKPDLIINPAAYTAVDQAESEPERAMRINGDAPGIMAQEAKKLGAAMIHFSTDYVFDGSKDVPYTEGDVPCPINVYGRTKLAGEQAVREAGIPHLILRTSWVYGMRGKNFLLTIRRLAQEREELRIVADQRGAPTWCRTIAEKTSQIISQLQASHANRHLTGIAHNDWQENSGLYHLTAQGKTTWYGFAEAILADSSSQSRPILTQIATRDFPLPAKRPMNSCLSCDLLTGKFGSLPTWSDALNLCLN